MRRRVLAVVALTASVTACSVPAPEGGPVGEESSPIMFGALDTTHQAVVSIFSSNAKCSGTIIQVVGTTGYALTAAHCCDQPLQVVRQGDDYAANPIDYPVIHCEVHPQYGNGFYDFAVVQFTGAGPSTPTIAPMTAAEDTLSDGDSVDIIGFGQTENGDTTKRRHIARPIDNETSLLLFYEQSTGGMCFGDSGGPAIALVGGSERVAGVSASVTDPSCLDYGVSGRVSAVTESFVLPWINGQPIGMQTCDQCSEASTSGVGTCAGKVTTCENDPDCSALLTCLDGCSTMACQQTCVDDHALGTQVYIDVFDCVCETACATECAGDAMCPAEPACGFSSKNMTCQTCFETSCCAAATACADDNFCSACYAKKPPAGCDQNALVTAFEDCLTASCTSECNLGSGSGGAGGSGVGGSGAGGSPAGVGGAGPTSSATTGSGETSTGIGPAVGAGGDDGASSSKTSGNSGDDGGCSTSPGPRTPGPASWWLAAVALLVSRARRSGSRAQSSARSVRTRSVRARSTRGTTT